MSITPHKIVCQSSEGKSITIDVCRCSIENRYIFIRLDGHHGRPVYTYDADTYAESDARVSVMA